MEVATILAQLLQKDTLRLPHDRCSYLLNTVERCAKTGPGNALPEQAGIGCEEIYMRKEGR